jgi:hypothetical protein
MYKADHLRKHSATVSQQFFATRDHFCLKVAVAQVSTKSNESCWHVQLLLSLEVMARRRLSSYEANMINSARYVTAACRTTQYHELLP